MTDLDTALRTMLRERAGDIDSLPADFAHLKSLDVLDHDPMHDVRRPHHTFWLVAAAVATVLAVVGTVLAVGSGGHSRVPAATHSPKVPPITAGPLPPVLRPTCTTALPQSWRSAIDRGTKQYAAVSAFPLALSSDGRRMLVARDHGQARDVILVDGDRTRVIYRVPQSNENQVEHAGIDGNYALINVERLPRNANVLGTVAAIVLVDLRTGAAKTLITLTEKQLTAVIPKLTIDGSALHAGHVYWDERPSYTQQIGTIKDYDIATGRTTTAAAGPLTQLELGRGVVWNSNGPGSGTIAQPLPAPVQTALQARGSRASVVTDGSSYAWNVTSRTVAWWAPGTSRVVELTLPKNVSVGLISVAGDSILYADGNSQDTTYASLLLDARTGAQARVPNVQPYAIAAHGVFAGYEWAGSGKDSPTQVVRFDTVVLPKLSC